jgi:predicted small integral membrane protein
MRKEMNSKSKKKWIVGGAIFFGSIALLTTGFATWSIGSQIAAQDGYITVTVDTAKNESIALEAVLDDSAIALKEAEVTDGVMVNVSQSEAVTNPLQISFSTLKITYGADFQFEFTKLVFSIEKTTTGTGTYVNGNNYLEDSADLINKRSGTEYTYIDAPAELAISGNSTTETVNNNKVTTFTQLTFDFSWGSYFNNKTPANYYNTEFNGASQSEIAAQSGNVAKELNDMNAAMTGTLQLHVKLA